MTGQGAPVEFRIEVRDVEGLDRGWESTTTRWRGVEGHADAMRRVAACRADTRTWGGWSFRVTYRMADKLRRGLWLCTVEATGLPPLGAMEEQVITWLCNDTTAAPDGGGWHVNDGSAPAPGLTFRQTTAALGRLRRKAYVTCHQWHPGQQGAHAEYLWYPTPAAYAAYHQQQAHHGR